MKPRFHGFAVIGLAPIVTLIVSVQAVPLISMIANSFQAEGRQQFTLEHYRTALTSPYYAVAIQNSLIVSLLSSLIGIAAALFIAYAITRFTARTRDILLMTANMTSNFSGVPLAFAYIVLLGYNGVLTIALERGGRDLLQFDLYSWGGIVLVYVYFQIPLATLLLYPLFYGIREDWRQAAALLGASPYSFWRRVGLPILLPGIVGTFGILFANAMGSYATAYALVGGNYNLLSIRISNLISGDVALRPELGSALAVILGLLMLAAVWLNGLLLRRARRRWD